MKRARDPGRGWWVRWLSLEDDYRPVNPYPPKDIIGWWCTGYSGDNHGAYIVAWVRADSEKAAKVALNKAWPERKSYDIFRPMEEGGVPGDRFPPCNWSKIDPRVQNSRSRGGRRGR